MHVRLVGITQPTINHGLEEDYLTPEQFIAYCARVSNPNNQENHETGTKLVKYLVDHNHWSPLEMVNIVLEVECTRDISRQLLRHQFKFQEYSLRYAEAKLGFEFSKARIQDPKNRQNSIDSDDLELCAYWDDVQLNIANECYKRYKEALDKGIAKELARKLLPEGLTLSRLYVNGTLRNFYHYCQLRMANGTQREHMDLAKACWNVISKEFPTLKGINNE